MTVNPADISCFTDGVDGQPNTAPVGAVAESLVQVQRAALMTLREEAVKQDRDLDVATAAHQQRVAWLSHRLENTTDQTQRRQKRLARTAKQRFEAELGQLERDHQAESVRHTGDAKKRREQIADETREIQKKTVADFEYDRWIAGSVFEGTVNKLKHWLTDRQSEQRESAQRLQALTLRVQEALESFRMPDLAQRFAADDEATASTDAPKANADTASSSADHATAPVSEGEPGAVDDTTTPPPRMPYPDAFQPDQPLGWYEDAARRFEQQSTHIARSPIPNLFVGVSPWVIATALVLVGSFTGLALPGKLGDNEIPPPVKVLMAGTLMLFFVIGLWWLAFRFAKRNTTQAVTELLDTHAEAADALLTFERWSQEEQASKVHDARTTRDAALHKAEAKHQPVIDELRQARRAKIDELDTILDDRKRVMADRHERGIAELQQEAQASEEKRKARLERREQVTQQRHDRDLALAERGLQERRDAIAMRWVRRRDAALATLASIDERARVEAPAWSDPGWDHWVPPREAAALATFGGFHVEPGRLLEKADADALGLPASLSMPAALSTPGPRSWMIEAEPDDRDAALSAMRSLVLRLLTTQPPGRVRLTLLDPVGLGESFAALMHLSDHDEQLVNSRAWSEPAQMERKLVDLTDHMALVIQKYLRNDFETIEAYNAQAGELAEPYRFLVMADFPHGLSDDGLARLSSIAAAGARCGVFVLLMRDPRKQLGRSIADDLRRHCVTIRREGRATASDGWRIRDEVFGRFPLTLDRAPGEARSTTLLQKIGAAAVEAERVQVPFNSITPDEQSRWSADSAEALSVPIGRTGATRLQRFTLGHGVEQHALVAGKTGSGKSSLLHALVTNLALWYPPDQLELYLIDFKKGVEFKPYVTNRLPHARAIAIESDRAFGLSILRELDRLMDERGEMYREAGVQVLAQFRRAKPQVPMPRVLLVVDEFQELFSRDDQLSQDAAMLLDRLVRQGRAFGVHALLGSQSLSGAAGLARGTLGQMAVRLALQCNEADSQLILNDENTAARLLSRPGEAIYNPRGGDIEGNSVFQIAWLPDEEHADALRAIDGLRQGRGIEPLPRAVFEGSAPALLAENPELRVMLDRSPAETPPAEPRAFVGEPIAIEAPTALRLLRQPGANALIVGGTADTALPLFISATVSLSAQHPAEQAHFVLLNGSSDPNHDEVLERLRETSLHPFDVVSPRDVAARLSGLHRELKRRLDEEAHEASVVYLMLFGVQRFRDLRKQEESFSFSLDDDDGGPKATPPDQALGEILRDGPALGIHVIGWADRAATVDGVFDRRDMREFDSRVLFQMSANDSAQLIDSTDANDLGSFRALLHREDRGTLSRFRPYGPVDLSWLKQTGAQLRGEATTA